MFYKLFINNEDKTPNNIVILYLIVQILLIKGFRTIEYLIINLLKKGG